MLFTIIRTFLQNINITFNSQYETDDAGVSGIAYLAAMEARIYYKYQLYRIYLIRLNKCRRRSAWESTRPEHSGVKLKTELS